MKRILLSAVTLLSVSLSAQVGINTTDPKATLDVNGDMKVSTKVGASDQTDALTVLENGKVGVNIKDFKNNSDDEAVLQVGGLIQSKTIRNANAPSADKVVVVDGLGVLRSVAKTALFGDDTDGMEGLKKKLEIMENELAVIKTVIRTRCSPSEYKVYLSTNGNYVTHDLPGSTLAGSTGPGNICMCARNDYITLHNTRTILTGFTTCD